MLVEDDENLGFVTCDNLQQAGFEVDWAKNGTQGLSMFARKNYNLCLLDIMLPNLDGFSLAQAIREENDQVPILFITARSMEEDRLRGFEIGGDDYITKPYAIKELLYRVNVFLRRQGNGEMIKTSTLVTIGRYQLDMDNLRLIIGNAERTLTQREADLLFMLLEKRMSLVKREDILEKLWGKNDYFMGRSLDVFISRLRKHLKEDPHIEIRNHHGIGFTLILPDDQEQ